MTNLAYNLTESARMYPDNVAIKLDEHTVTYSELDEATNRMLAKLTEWGVQPGDRVAIMLPNIPAFPVLFYAVLRAGGVVVPMNPLFKEREVAYYLKDSGAKLIFVFDQFAEAAKAGAATAGAQVQVIDARGVAPLLADLDDAEVLAIEAVAREDSDTAVILYTSGTTGNPKGARLTHRNLNLNQAVTGRTLIHIDDTQVLMGCLPLFHVFGLTCGLNTAIAAGACLTLIPRFDPGKALEVIERDKVTIMEGVPTMYNAMLHHPDGATRDLSSLRICVSGGSALPVEVMRAFEQKFDCVIIEGYGLSETSPVASFNQPGFERKPGSIGFPVEGVTMRLVDPLSRKEVSGNEIGEIQIAGHGVMAGYWQKPEASAAAIDADGWFSSGDLARRDEDGYYYIVDRAKDLIIRGGYNVYPREIEEVLYEHPAVAEVAVLGEPHPELGEEIAAAVVLKQGAQATTQEVIDFVKERVAAYKYPRHVWFLDALPKTATGKILKRSIEIPD